MFDILKYNLREGNKVILLDSYQKLMSQWDFLHKGFQDVTTSNEANLPNMDVETFFKVLLLISTAEDEGFLLVLTSKKGKQLGFAVCRNTTVPLFPRTLNILMTYSTGRCPSTVAELRLEVERLARESGYQKLQATTYRVRPLPHVSGAVRRFFNKTLRLNEKSVNFETTL